MDRRRQLGYAAAQPFTITDIILYGVTQGFKNDMRFFFRAMSRLDDEFMKRQDDKLKKEKSKSKSKSPRKGSK